MVSMSAGASFSGALEVLLPSPQRFGRAAAAQTQWQPDAPDGYCRRCGVTAGPGAVTESGCTMCRGKPIAWQRAVRLGPYRPPLAEWIRQMKFHAGWPWAAWLGRQLAARIELPSDDVPLVVHVPLHWMRRVGRGYDQSRLMAEALAGARGWPAAPLLRRMRRTRPQSNLRTQADHKKNVRGAFAAAGVDVGGRTVVLVDDVKTSGQTARVCARVLQRAGAGTIVLATAAVADPRGPWVMPTNPGN